MGAGDRVKDGFDSVVNQQRKEQVSRGGLYYLFSCSGLPGRLYLRFNGRPTFLIDKHHTHDIKLPSQARPEHHILSTWQAKYAC